MSFTLKRDSRLARWAYFFDDSTLQPDGRFNKVPPSTTLCALFWRAFVFVPLGVAVLVALLIFVLSAISHVIFTYPLRTLITLLCIAVIALFIRLVATLVSAKDRFADTLFVQGVKAVKGKFCPIIKFD